MALPVRATETVLPGPEDRLSVYGTAVGYRYTGRKEYITYFKRVTRYFLEHLPKDLCPYWDLTFGEGDEEPRDSSSGVIAVCGMLEMSKYMEAEDSRYYRSVALKLLKSIIENYMVKIRRTAMDCCSMASILRKHPIIPVQKPGWTSVLSGEIISIWRPCSGF